MLWKKMSDIAKELGVSKDVIKYHKKSLPDTTLRRSERNEILISEEGIEQIKGRLKKGTYTDNFETFVRKELRELNGKADLYYDFLLHRLGSQEPEIITIPSGNPPIKNNEHTSFSEHFYTNPREALGQGFIEFYCQKRGDIDSWTDWRWDFVTLPDIEEYFVYLREQAEDC